MVLQECVASKDQVQKWTAIANGVERGKLEGG